MLELKKCTTCRELKHLSSFYTQLNNKDGLFNQCKICHNTRGKLYYKKTIETRSLKQKDYYKRNKEYINKKHKEYDYLNREDIALRKQNYYVNNKKSIKDKRKIQRDSFCTNKYFIFKINNINPYYSAVLQEDLVKVKCYKCNIYFKPLVKEIRSFVEYSNGFSNMYCSDKCKHSCKVFNFKSNMVDPESKLYISKSEQYKTRSCQTSHLKQLQIDKIGYNYCEKCGTKGNVELHHTLPVAKFGLEAVNAASHILVCNACHKEFTKQCADKVMI